MHRIDRVLHLSVLTATAIGTYSLLPAAPAQAVNLIQNGNFEANGGSFANWTLSAPTNPDIYVGDGDNGTKTAVLGPATTEALSQTVTTVANTPYQIKFDLLSDGIDGIVTNSFEARVNNAVLFPSAFIPSTKPTSPTSPYPSSFRPFSFSYTGTGSDKLEFRFKNDSFFQLDNVVFDGQVAAATRVPEPLTILGTIVGGSAALKLRKKLNTKTAAKV
jgi:hypothetical protein